jgi:hypothetical protein
VTDVIVHGRIKDKVKNGLEEFNRIQLEIQNAVKDLIPQISHNMGRAGMATGDLINTDCTPTFTHVCHLTFHKEHRISEPTFAYDYIEVVGRQLLSWDEHKELILVASALTYDSFLLLLSCSGSQVYT